MEGSLYLYMYVMHSDSIIHFLVQNEDESMRLHRQEVLKKQAATAAAQAVMAASPQDYLPIMSRPEDNYDIGSLKSEDSTDDEVYHISQILAWYSKDEPRKHIPLWAQKPALKAALYKQHVSDLSPSNIFPVVEAPVLSDIFPNTSKPR